MLAVGCVTIKKRIEVRKEDIRPQLESSEENLLASYNEQARAVLTLQATVDLIPSTGSTHSGVIEEYHDVTGFILAQRPAAVRVIGQAPVVAKNIFDMFSDGDEFRIYIPSKNEFLIGPTTLTRPSNKPIENLRPNHIVDALFWPELKAGKNVLFEQFDLDEGRYYILTLLREVDGGKLETARKIWYDRTNLRVSRVQLFGAAGRLDSDITYSDWRPAGTTPATGIARVAAQTSYARDIKIWRPQDDYKLEIQILKLTLNEHISADRFVLDQPDGSNLVHIGEKISGPTDDPAVRLKRHPLALGF
jgi:outer membrane lipoprotein-sorting protein